MKSHSGVPVNPSESRVAHSRRNTKSQPEMGTQVSVPNTSMNVSRGVANYERKKWEIRYEWLVEVFDEHPMTKNRWGKIGNPLPFDEAIKRMITRRRKYLHVRVRNVKNGEVIHGEIFS